MHKVPDVNKINILFKVIQYAINMTSFAVGGGYIVDKVFPPLGFYIKAELSLNKV